MNRGFWETLEKPIVALAPMDGVTDAAFRCIVDKYGKPSILFTEFTNVEGICHGASALLRAFIYHKTTTPTVAQIFGSTPGDFYKVAFVIAEMGFDGIDINMGCPDEHVSKKGGGAGLIRTPALAQEIVKQVKQASEDWANGREISDVGLQISVLDWVKNFQKQHSKKTMRRILPVSVKTRMGYDEIVTESWMSTLLEVEPANITLHARTLQQMYAGEANWDEIGKAAKLIKKTKTSFLGNGDVKSREDALEKIKKYGVDGVLIGRATYGNPWVFQGKSVDLPTKLGVALEQCKVFNELTPTNHFLSLRKHLGWYCKGFDHAADVRLQLLQANTIEDVESIVSRVKNNLSN